MHQEASFAITTDSAQVTLAGNILDTPCSIAPGSRYQTINIGSTPVGVIAQNGYGRSVPFSIQLKDCELARFSSRLPDWRGVRVIFDGLSDGQDFSVHGSASGVALRILDTEGHVAIPGRPLSSFPIMAGDQTLNFMLQLVSDHKPLKKGEYHAVIQFGLSYF